eukprot:TRINITY_DN19824_c0_g1_i6.p1 TRINITY_DN19824_c0_g1~~TRINITY_DN19824_c0_g1_i6.p1  ORF type:complete len:353 (-),score=49.90 TRINITY_DN19824_c0_g1_i6:327-1385(-)
MMSIEASIAQFQRSRGDVTSLTAVSLPDLSRDFLEGQAYLNAVDRVARHYDVPCCFIALNSPDGMVIRARLGIHKAVIPYPKDGHCMCQHHTDRDLPIIIDDTSKCRRVRDDPLVAGPPFLKFFAETPIKMGATTYIGTLCIGDSKLRGSPMTLDDCAFLGLVAQEIAALLSTLAAESRWAMTMGSLASLPALSEASDELEPESQNVTPLQSRQGTDITPLQSRQGTDDNGSCAPMQLKQGTHDTGIGIWSRSSSDLSCYTFVKTLTEFGPGLEQHRAHTEAGYPWHREENQSLAVEQMRQAEPSSPQLQKGSYITYHDYLSIVTGTLPLQQLRAHTAPGIIGARLSKIEET